MAMTNLFSDGCDFLEVFSVPRLGPILQDMGSDVTCNREASTAASGVFTAYFGPSVVHKIRMLWVTSQCDDDRTCESLTNPSKLERDDSRKANTNSCTDGDTDHTAVESKPVACTGFAQTISVDLLTGFDLTDAAMRKLLISEVKNASPPVMMLSPPCTMYSSIQRFPEQSTNP